MDRAASRFFLPGQSRKSGALAAGTDAHARAASSPNAADVGGTRAGEAGAHHPGPGLLLHEIPATAGDPGRVGHAHRETGVSSQNSPAGNGVAAGHDVVPTTPAGAFSGAAISTLAKGLTELSGALLTIARALHSLAPHPTAGRGNGPSVSTGPRPAARGESTGTPKRGAEPRPASPTPQRRARPTKWSDERRQILRDMRAARRTAPEILAAVNAAEGEQVTMPQMHAFAYSIGIRTNGSAPRSSTCWNPARDALLREGWERGDDAAEILAAVNAIPEQQQVASEDAIKSRVDKLKLRRSKEGFRRVRDRANEKISMLARTWSDAMIALLRAHYPDNATPLPVLAGKLTKIADKEVTVLAIQQKAWELGVSRPRGPRAATQPAAAAAQARASGAPSAPKAAPAVPPVITTEIPRAEPTNPAREMAVSAGPLPRPTAQSSAAAGGAPRPPSFAIGFSPNGARQSIVAAPQPDDEPPPYDPTSKGSVESRTARAKALLRAGKDETYVQMQTRIGLREVMRLVGEIRRERAA